MPRSMAESTFNLRSFEYAFMDLFLCRSAIYATRCYECAVSGCWSLHGLANLA
jgi:hypothetical protein